MRWFLTPLGKPHSPAAKSVINGGAIFNSVALILFEYGWLIGK
jgi:hypothetical protein